MERHWVDRERGDDGLDVSARCCAYMGVCFAMPEARGRLPKGCRMFQRPRDLSAPLSTHSALISSAGAKATTVARECM